MVGERQGAHLLLLLNILYTFYALADIKLCGPIMQRNPLTFIFYSLPVEYVFGYVFMYSPNAGTFPTRGRTAPGLEEWMGDWNFRGKKGIVVAGLEENAMKYMLSPREMSRIDLIWVESL